MEHTKVIEVENCIIEISENGKDLIITQFNEDSIETYQLSDYISLNNDEKIIKKIKIEVSYEEKGVRS